jgi:hypothetical protein
MGRVEYAELSRERMEQIDQFIANLNNNIIDRDPLTQYEEDLYNKVPEQYKKNEFMRKHIIREYILSNESNYNKFVDYILDLQLNPHNPEEGIELKTFKNNAVNGDLISEPNWPKGYGGSKKFKKRFTKRKKPKFTTKKCKQFLLFKPKSKSKTKSKSMTKSKK